NAVLLRPLPFPAADRLVRVYNTYPKAGVPDDGASFTNYYERRGAIAAFSGVSLYREGTALVGEPGSTEREPVMRVTSDFFATLGAGPLLGRAFTEDEMNVEAGRVAILTDGYWRQRFNGDPGVVGRTIRVDGAPRLVVGILPPSFRFLSSRARLYFPLVTSPDNRGPMQRHSGSSSQMVARLRPDSAIERAQAEVDAHNASLEAGSPTAKMIADAGFRSLVMPLHGEHVAAVRPVLLFVQAGAVCLLLIGGVNLVNLLLIRATTRSRELVVGLAAGAIGIRLLATLGTSLLPLGAQIGFDTSVASAGVLAALVLGAAMALPIAWYSLRSPAAAALALDSRGATAGPGVRRVRHAFLVAQVALAFALLSAAGVLGLSLERVTAISPGFNSARVLSGQI